MPVNLAQRLAQSPWELIPGVVTPRVWCGPRWLRGRGVGSKMRNQRIRRGGNHREDTPDNHTDFRNCVWPGKRPGQAAAAAAAVWPGRVRRVMFLAYSFESPITQLPSSETK